MQHRFFKVYCITTIIIKSHFFYTYLIQAATSAVALQSTVGNVVLEKRVPRAEVWPPLVYTNRIGSHSRVDEGVIVASCRINCLLFRTIWCCPHLLNRAFNMNGIGFQQWATKMEWELAGNYKDWGSRPFLKCRSVYAKSKQQYTAACREDRVYPGGIHEWRKTEQGDW